jgi:catechol 2,3-dioxygenase-like lactoylglutathione lyase family enzyme
MTILALDHVQLAIIPGRESEARAFYGHVLGLVEVPKPASMAARGGMWFHAGEPARVKVHLGLEPGFVPSLKAHPAFVVDDLEALLERARSAGHRTLAEQPLDGYQRAFVYDPFGNRIELMQRAQP